MADLIDGIKVKLGNKEYFVPPLNFKRLRQLKADIELLSSVKGTPTDEQMNAVVKVVHSAIERNYPDLTIDDVEEMLDLANAGTVVKAIMGGAGLVARAESGE